MSKIYSIRRELAGPMFRWETWNCLPFCRRATRQHVLRQASLTNQRGPWEARPRAIGGRQNTNSNFRRIIDPSVSNLPTNRGLTVPYNCRYPLQGQTETSIAGCPRLCGIILAPARPTAGTVYGLQTPQIVFMENCGPQVTAASTLRGSQIKVDISLSMVNIAFASIIRCKLTFTCIDHLFRT